MTINHPITEDAAAFADALEAFADLSPKDQTTLLADLRAGCGSAKPEINAARTALADAIDGAFDEDIADALRAGTPEANPSPL